MSTSATAPPPAFQPQSSSSAKDGMSHAPLPKPKRPLSGYNLFYRYKRNKVVAATAGPDGTPLEGISQDVVRSILTAPPGLEGVPPNSPLLLLPPPQMNQFRAAAIRSAMEGKLFPNEDVRKRQHTKVHGMGFVEMGRTMRQMWGRADKLTKDVFCELADVGRVRYRRLVAEYKRSLGGRQENHHPESGSNEAAHNHKGEPVVHEANHHKRPFATSANEAMAGPLPATFATPSMNHGRRVTTDFFFGAAPLPSQARSHGRSRGDLFNPLAFNPMMMPAAKAAHQPPNFEPLPVGSSSGAGPRLARRVSDNNIAVETVNDVEEELLRRRVDLAAQQVLLRNALKDIQDKFARKRATWAPLPEPAPVSGPVDVDVDVDVDGEGTGVSARDFMELLGKMDDHGAVGNNDDEASVAVSAIGEAGDLSALDGAKDEGLKQLDPSVLFGGAAAFIGKPSMPDAGFAKKPSLLLSTVPMPAGIELRTNRARMA